MFNLSVTGNWNKLFGERKLVEYTQGSPAIKQYKYKPIPPTYLTINSNTLLIGVQSNSAAKHWYLGAKVAQYLYISPSSTRNLIQGVQTSEERKVRLNQFNLISFQDYNIYPYVLAIEIPYWFEDIYVEVWEYNGIVENSKQQFDIEEMQKRLERIEYKLDNQYLT